MVDETSIVIIGGGMTGLAAAHELTARGVRAFRLLEADGRLGGKIVTEHAHGFLVEGGPDSFITFKPAALELCRELGIADRLQGTRPDRRGSFVRRSGRLAPLPAGLTGLVPLRLLPLLTTPLLSLPGKLRAGLEPLAPRRLDGRDESVAEFTTRRFGREVYDWLVEPLLAGIHAADGAALSVAASYPNLLEMERAHGGMLRMMLRARPRSDRNSDRGSPFMTPRDGTAELVNAIARTLPHGSVRTGATARAVEHVGSGYRVHLTEGPAVDARAVIVTTPAHAARRLLAGLDRDLADGLGSIEFVSTATISLGYRAGDVPHSLDGYGYLSPRAEGGPIVACTWASSKFAGRAPDGHALLRVFVGRAGLSEIVGADDATLIALARTELRQALGIDAAPILTRVYRWPDGIPQYNVGHLERVAAIDALVDRHAGLFVAGASYRGAGLPDCIGAGRRAGRAAGKFTSGRPRQT